MRRAHRANAQAFSIALGPVTRGMFLQKLVIWSERFGYDKTRQMTVIRPGTPRLPTRDINC